MQHVNGPSCLLRDQHWQRVHMSAGVAAWGCVGMQLWQASMLSGDAGRLGVLPLTIG